MINKFSDITVIIPSYKPDSKLINTLTGIKAAGFDDIIVVDDGGGDEYFHFFGEAERIGCTVLHHEVNRGKGAALKTAFSYFAENRRDFAGAVTADADGQHLPEDIAAVALEMKEKGSVILGSRDFSDPHVPTRSRFGNRCTSLMFRLFIGMKITDTQTGLRAIPSQYIRDVMDAKGDRYEYETQMLFLMKQKKIPYVEKTISTVYIDDNASSHFRPVRDSLRIYSMILMFAFSSLASTAAENLLYLLSLLIVGTFLDKVYATVIFYVIARIMSSILNYTLNAKVVFNGKTNKQTLLRYMTLAVCLLITAVSLSGSIVWVFDVKNPIINTCIKICVDTALFFLSFRIQHSWVFGETSENKKEDGN